MKLGDFNSDVTLTWESGGVTAPVDVWVGQILLALPQSTQKMAMDAVISEINRRNKLVEDTSENTD